MINYLINQDLTIINVLTELQTIIHKVKTEQQGLKDKSTIIIRHFKMPLSIKLRE